ncbi:MAG: glycerol-3-phosphate acyltransferase [Clostridia bacterium]|nr:glycerol-3-phosphate acyltransferase [Clostridia bacterium]
MTYWLLAIMVVVSYFVGCVNFGKIISSAKNVDLTKKGSGNLGATNMYRNLGAKLGYLTLLLDMLKGIITSLAGFFVFGGAGAYPDALIGLYACGLSAVVGHIFPVINKFKGGKGISTTIGVFLVAQPIVTLCAFAVGFVIVWFIKYVSLASLILVTAGVVAQNLLLPEPNLTISLLTFAIFALTWFAHRKNIERLIVGKENETNIKMKIKRDQKKMQKLEIKQEQFEAKLEIKHEIKQEKAEQKVEKKVQKYNAKYLKKSTKHHKRKTKGKSKKKKKN